MKQAVPLTAWHDHMQAACQATFRDYSLFQGVVNIDSVRAEIHSYEMDIELLQRMLDLKRALISPIRQHPLPSEILSMIFLTCRDEDVANIVTISHVCRLWRQIALGRRVLWNYIELDWHERSFERVQAWLDRSQPLPVTLSLSGYNMTIRDEFPSLLLNTLERWESISIHHCALDLGGLWPCQWQFPRLKSLRVLEDGDYLLDLKSIAAILRNNATINALSLSGSDFDEIDGWPQDQLVILKQSTNHLTNLTLGELVPIEATEPMPVNIILGLLSACPSLVSLECHHTCDAEEFSSPDVLALPCLRELSLGDGGKTCVLLRFLDVPQLRSLRIFRPPVKTDDSIASRLHQEFADLPFTDLFRTCLEALRNNCAPSLTRLVWEGSPRHWRTMFPVFNVFPALREIEFRALSIVQTLTLSNLLLASSPQTTLRWLVPNLHTLTFCDCDIVDFEALATMLETRNDINPKDKSPPVRIKAVQVDSCPSITGEAWARILKSTQPSNEMFGVKTSSHEEASADHKRLREPNQGFPTAAQL